MEDTLTPPTKAGFYWGKSGSYGWYNLLIEVEGEAPFLRCTAWNTSSGAVGRINPEKIEKWGPKIERPKS